MNKRTRVLICGAGSGAHALAGMISLRSDMDVRVFVDSAGKACRWRERMNRHPLIVTLRNEASAAPVDIQAKQFSVTHDPEYAAANRDIVLFVLPAFLHLKYMKLLAPHLEEGCVVVGLPGQNGFEFDARDALGSKIGSCILMNFESLPWVCRNVDLGRAVEITSVKSKLVGALQGDIANARISDPLACLQDLFGERPKLIISGHLLGMTLVSPNAYCHPPIMYGCWKDWDGQPLDRPPLFYHTVDEYTGDLLGKISEEVLAISHRISAEYPQVDLSEVIPIYDWDIVHYGKYIRDKTNITTANRTNGAYVGITHPMLQSPNGTYLPDFNHRFMTEDVPYGLVVIRGIAEIAGVETPYIDTVLSWCQDVLDKEYLLGSRLAGKDIDASRCPQRYGYTGIPEVLGV